MAQAPVGCSGTHSTRSRLMDSSVHSGCGRLNMVAEQCSNLQGSRRHGGALQMLKNRAPRDGELGERGSDIIDACHGPHASSLSLIPTESPGGGGYIANEVPMHQSSTQSDEKQLYLHDAFGGQM